MSEDQLPPPYGPDAWFPEVLGKPKGKPFEQVSDEDPRYAVYRYFDYMLRSLVRLHANETVVAVGAANTTVLEWQADDDCYVQQIIMSGTANDRKLVFINGVLFASTYHLANTDAKLTKLPFLFKLRKGHRITVVSGTAAAGNHVTSLLGFYEKPIR